MADRSRETYYIHNTSRSPRTREIRRLVVGPDRSKLNLLIGGGTLTVRRGRPLSVSGAILMQFIRELISLEGKGLVEVYNHRSQRVDLFQLLPPVATQPIVSEGLKDELPPETESSAPLLPVSETIDTPDPELPGSDDSDFAVAVTEVSAATSEPVEPEPISEDFGGPEDGFWKGLSEPPDDLPPAEELTRPEGIQGLVEQEVADQNEESVPDKDPTTDREMKAGRNVKKVKHRR